MEATTVRRSPMCLPFQDAVGLDFILMDGNARPHRVHLVHEFLESEDIHRIDCPVRSADLNPKQHSLDALGRATATGNSLPSTIQGLKTEYRTSGKIILILNTSITL
ncbi:uncharacterized protein TNCV_2465331 [Trichonephila clavipes]|uniref:Tc1-like transposase DDE domain-containing protein n=1 Tax=Trichonephila clavipes TaxID=2585209 RepID=A0A8X6R4Z4_TRICX|nr:uncharacterized protein TNCV_2465331 [Trichonephila clavipes]